MDLKVLSAFHAGKSDTLLQIPVTVTGGVTGRSYSSYKPPTLILTSLAG